MNGEVYDKIGIGITHEEVKAGLRELIAKNGRVEYELVGENGNAYAIMGRCAKALRRNGWDRQDIATVQDYFTSGDYNRLLFVAAELQL